MSPSRLCTFETFWIFGTFSLSGSVTTPLSCTEMDRHNTTGWQEPPALYQLPPLMWLVSNLWDADLVDMRMETLQLRKALLTWVETATTAPDSKFCIFLDPLGAALHCCLFEVLKDAHWWSSNRNYQSCTATSCGITSNILMWPIQRDTIMACEWRGSEQLVTSLNYGF